MQGSYCIGWWEQAGFGRQPMNNLVVEFSAGHLSGSGMDIVGEFTLQGHMQSDGQIRLVKQYVGRHQVIYLGQYDGEGTFFGTWVIDVLHGSWSIKILAGRGDSQPAIQEILPWPQASHK